MDHILLYYVWPWIGLGAGIVLLIFAFFTDVFRLDNKLVRWLDPAWLAWLAASLHFLHNLEEYGIDFTGKQYAFPELCRQMNIMNLQDGFFLGVNIGFVWITGPVIAILARKYKALSPAIGIFILLNGISHTLSVIKDHAYGAGFGTGLFLMIPVGVWVIYVCFIKNKYPWKIFFTNIGIAFFYMALLLADQRFANSGAFGSAMQAIWMAGAAIICIGLYYFTGKRFSEKFDFERTN